VRIGVFAASGPVDPERIRRGCELLRSWGHELVVQTGVERRRGYLAGTDPERLTALVEGCRGVDLGMAARGGYGLHRLLPDVPWDQLEAPVLGFSDLTALHLARWSHTSRGGWHGPVVGQLVDLAPEALEGLRRFLDHPGPVVLEGSGGPDAPVHGTVLGGNLALIAGLVGTPWLRWPEDTILVLEDVGEAPYRLDRMMMQLELSGLPERLRGVGLGAFTRCGEAGSSVVLERVERWGVPFLLDLPFGHGDRNLPFGLGAPGVLASGRLEIGAIP